MNSEHGGGKDGPPGPDDAPIPVTLLTGFLGSGKTTLLNALLGQDAFSNTAVLVNEFGEIGIDHVLVEAVDDEIVLLNEGCLCCTIRGDLSRTMRDLYLKRIRGDVPPFTRLMIETTGLADPAPIIHTLLTDDVIRHRYALDGIIVTVDALNGASELDCHPESVKQAAVADALILTKTDLVDGPKTRPLVARLHALNPGAHLVEAAHGNVPAELLFGHGLNSDGSAEKARTWLRAESYIPEHEHSHAGNANRHDKNIRAICLTYDKPFDWVVLTVWIQKLIMEHGENLLRIKGIVHLAGEDAPMAIHGVQHIFHDPVRLAPDTVPDKVSRIVFITDGLEREALERDLNELISKDRARV